MWLPTTKKFRNLNKSHDKNFPQYAKTFAKYYSYASKPYFGFGKSVGKYGKDALNKYLLQKYNQDLDYFLENPNRITYKVLQDIINSISYRYELKSVCLLESIVA